MDGIDRRVCGGYGWADARLVPLPLGCGGSGSGGDEFLGLDLRLMNGVWGTDVSELGGDMWPVRVGSLGLKNKACGFNAQGPWLASCVRGDTDVVGTEAMEKQNKGSSLSSPSPTRR